MEYVTPLLDWAVEMLCKAFETNPQPIPNSMRAPCMRVIACPKWLSHLHSIDIADEFVRKLAVDDQLICPITVFSGKPWIRISGNIYNSQDDYIRLRETIMSYK